MTVTQLSVFVENRPGHLNRVLEQVAEGGVNIRGLSASDTGDYGIVRLIVDEPARALAFLENSGTAVKAAEILCVQLDDEPGELRRMMRALGDAAINVIYCYSITDRCVALSVDDVALAEDALTDAGFSVLTSSDIAALPTAVATRGL